MDRAITPHLALEAAVSLSKRLIDQGLVSDLTVDVVDGEPAIGLRLSFRGQRGLPEAIHAIERSLIDRQAPVEETEDADDRRPAPQRSSHPVPWMLQTGR